MCGFGKKIEFKLKSKMSFENVFEKEKAILSPPFSGLPGPTSLGPCALPLLSLLGWPSPQPGATANPSPYSLFR